MHKVNYESAAKVAFIISLVFLAVQILGLGPTLFSIGGGSLTAVVGIGTFVGVFIVAFIGVVLEEYLMGG